MTYYDDDDEPVKLDEWNGLRPGMSVIYAGTLPLPGVFVLDALLDYDGDVEAEMHPVEGGEVGSWGCCAGNLLPAPSV